ncbi:hypothetical protein EMGR_001819 [Emarellia grisea]
MNEVAQGVLVDGGQGREPGQHVPRKRLRGGDSEGAEGLAAAVAQPRGGPVRVAIGLQHHLLVVPHEAGEGTGRIALKMPKDLDHPGALGTTIHVVAQADDASRSPGSVQVDLLQQPEQRIGAPVDVADRVVR